MGRRERRLEETQEAGNSHFLRLGPSRKRPGGFLSAGVTAPTRLTDEPGHVGGGRRTIRAEIRVGIKQERKKLRPLTGMSTRSPALNSGSLIQSV